MPVGICKGRPQFARRGSYAEIPSVGLRHSDEDFEVSFYVQPYLIDAGHLSTLISCLDVNVKLGFAVLLQPTGILEAWLGNGYEIEIISSTVLPLQWRWYHVVLQVVGCTVSLAVNPIVRLAEKTAAPARQEKVLSTRPVLNVRSPVLIAAGLFDTLNSHCETPASFFNGRVDSPVFRTLGSSSRVLAKYDFAVGIPTDTIYDMSGSEHHGRLYNCPTRAVKGYNWDGSEPDWTKAQFGYGAIHFHEDDLDDAGWETDFNITIPLPARSGAYAAEITVSGRVMDMITFFVRPAKNMSRHNGGENREKVAIVLSTFTYLAYANEHAFERTTYLAQSGIREDENYHKVKRRADLGLSLYDKHRDGSGIIYSTAKRPLLNVRPGYVHWGFHRPREFSADLFMIGFLEKMSIAYDVCTDHDLHTDGAEILSQYNTVITGCHPEYPSLQSLDAYSTYAKNGGNIMYLGGNGFYVRPSRDPLFHLHLTDNDAVVLRNCF